MKRAATILITALLLIAGAVAMAAPLQDEPGSCCAGCPDADGSCCTDFVCCHGVQLVSWAGVQSILQAEDPIVGTTDLLSQFVIFADLERSLDRPPKTVSC